jgi:3,4-dihydroxy 2-butanone 4-phosphate synthase/GTP cyclohydrolase II
MTTTRLPVAAHDGTQVPAIQVQARATLPTRHGAFETLAYVSDGDPTPHLALVLGDPAGHDVLVRVHSECLTGEVLGSLRCDCGDQLDQALRHLAFAGRGVVVYLRGHEGRGIGLVDKLRAYALQESGLDTIDANLALGRAVDERSYEAAAGVLSHLGVRSVALMTNNPDKVLALSRCGVPVHRTIPMMAAVNRHNQRYLHAKADRLGHAGLAATAARKELA